MAPPPAQDPPDPFARDLPDDAPVVDRPDAPHLADPGSPRAARFAWLIFLTLLAAIALLQQAGVSSASGPRATAPDRVPALTSAEFVQARLAMILRGTLGPEDRASLTEPASPAPLHRLRSIMLRAALERTGGEEPAAPRAPGHPPAPSPREELDALIAELAAMTTRPSADPAGADPADPLAPALLEDARLVRAMLDADTPSGAITPPQRDRLVAHHQVIARVLLTRGLPETDPDRARYFAGAERLVIIMLVAILAGALALITGLLLLIVGLVRRRNAELPFRFVPPWPGGSVMLETAAVFVAGFLALKAVVAAVAGVDPDLAGALQLTLQWALLLVPLWPLVRGVSWTRTRRLLGLHSGRGLLDEIAAGVVGYLACVPLFALGVLLSLLMLLITAALSGPAGAAGPPPPPANPVAELLLRLSGWSLVAFVLLAVVWAPLVEECIFRGALFRHLRARLAPAAAALLSSAAFALMHGYALVMMGPVLMLGVGFALLREWRGSLIAPVIAHALHNATLVALMLLVADVVFV